MARIVKPSGKNAYEVKAQRQGLDRPVLMSARRVMNLAPTPPKTKPKTGRPRNGA